MKPIYRRSIAVGLAGILIIIALFLFSAYMANRDVVEHRSVIGGPDSDLAGAVWWLFFFVTALFALVIIGALSAWASRQDITSTRGTILASALTGLVPIGLATIIVISMLIIAFVSSPGHYSKGFSSTLFPLFFIYLLYAAIGLTLSITGGLLYAALAKALRHVKTRRV